MLWGLQVLCLSGRPAPVVIAAISESNGRCNEFRWICAVEGGYLDRYIVTPNFFDMSSRK